MNEGVKEEIIERIVIDYANLSGRESAHRAEFREKVAKHLDNLLQAEKENILKMVDCEIDCIKDGNALTPIEQDIAIKVARNIKERLTT